MKTAIKFALIGSALVAGTAAQAATFNVPVTSVGGSDLMLFVSDLTTSNFFAMDLGNKLDTIYSKAQVIADGAKTNPAGTFNTPTGIAGLNSTLAAFLGTITNHSDNVVWEIFAGDRSATNLSLGSQRALVTSTNDLSGVDVLTFTNTQISSYTSKLNTFVNILNTNYAGGNTSTFGGFADGNAASGGANSETAWVGQGVGAGIGSAQTMYVFGTNGNPAASQSNAYVGGLVNIGWDGVVTVTNASAPEVPLPAAVWLLGSGLLGLLGVGRRRAA
jgi:hypothetical protein